LMAGGFTAIDTSCAGVTLNSVEPATEPNVALIVAVPTATLLAIPLLLIVAEDCVSDAHVAAAVKSCVVLSVKVPMAVNCCVVPKAMEKLFGVTAMETSAAALTVSVVEPCTEPEIAVMVADPVAKLAANPCVPLLLLIVATEVVSELHCTVAVTSCVLPSVKVPVAENCFVVPKGIVGIAGVTAIETNVAGFTVMVVVPETDPNVAVTPVLPMAMLAATP
jgi:hypothetical protein